MKNMLHKSNRGQTLVEFALVIPILLLLSVAIFDLGRAVYYTSVLHNAAREGARYGIIHPNDVTGMERSAKDYAIGLGLSSLNVSAGLGPVQVIGGINNPTVKVTVSYSYKPATPLVAQFMPCGCGAISLIGQAIMRTEALPTP